LVTQSDPFTKSAVITNQVVSKMNTTSSSSEAPILLYQVEQGIATLTLNQPRKFNVLSEGLLIALHEALDTIAEDRAVRVVIIAGAGRAFCAGHDLKEMRANPDRKYYEPEFWITKRPKERRENNLVAV